jgi:adiponectin receptor
MANNDIDKMTRSELKNRLSELGITDKKGSKNVLEKKIKNKLEKDVIDGLKNNLESTGQMNILDIVAVPDYLQTNQNIHHGYRHELSARQCVVSVFEVHCETGNIWTQLIPGIIFAGLCSAQLRNDNNFSLDLFVYSAIVVMGYFTSAAAHTFSPVSRTVKLRMFKCDHTTIIVCGCACGIMHWRYALHGFNHDIAVLAEELLIASTLVAIVIFWMLPPSWLGAAGRLLRTVCVLVVLLGGNFPVLQHTALQGIDPLAVSPFVLFVVGGLFYLFQFPERLWPGGFDIIGHSQQILHVCFGFAHVIQYMFISNNVQRKTMY